MNRLSKLLTAKKRIVAGLMSGTSLDGVDVAVAAIDRTVDGISVETLAFESHPYPEWLRSLLLLNSSNATAKLETITRLNLALARQYADAVASTLVSTRIDSANVDLIGCHGQTICHVPVPQNDLPAATLQIGDPSALANLTGIPVVGDFRTADMSIGGQGAPLVPYFDHLMFSDADQTRASLNIGGIANISILPAGSDIDDILAFDTGPGNMVLDILAQRLLNKPFDEGGAVAASGEAHQPVVAEVLSRGYFVDGLPKSTGREDFGHVFVAQLVELLKNAGVTNPPDVMATAAELTVRSISDGYERHIKKRWPIDELIVAGGGVRNDHLMSRLQQVFEPVPVVTTARYGISTDGKEAICFAVLANETIDGYPSNVPSVTGAAFATILGKICLPRP